MSKYLSYHSNLSDQKNMNSFSLTLLGKCLIKIFIFNLIFVFLSVFFCACNTTVSEENENELWKDAKWIVYNQLPDTMKVIPAVHGWGNGLGNKCLDDTIVPMFTKSFNIKGEVEYATVSISGLGQYVANINGKRLGDRFMAPGWTLYQKRQFYNNYNITELVKQGENILGVIVGNGFFNILRKRYRKIVGSYGSPRLIFHISIRYTDGSISNVTSDSSCKVTCSPIRFTSIYGGEDYDARKELAGWDTPGFNYSEWKNAVEIDATTAKLELEKDFPLKIMQEFEPEKIIKSGSGKMIFDFGQNASGIISIKVKGARGTRIRIRPDEILNDALEVTQKSGGGPYEFNYILSGNGIEEWQPMFTYYGFRYAELEIIESEPNSKKTELMDIRMLHTRNSAPFSGSFSCSDTLMNSIYELILWSIKSNMASISTDCPHREKLGWLEQTYLMGPSLHYNFDISSFYRKIIGDIFDSQAEDGLIPDIAPEYVKFKDGFRDSPEWGSAGIILPWLLFKWYGDTDILKKAYPMMKKYISYLESKTVNNILNYGLGDWNDLGPDKPGEAQLTPKAVTGTAIYYYDLNIIKDVAFLLKMHDDADIYSKMAGEVKSSFILNLYDSNTGICSGASQTAYAISIYTKIIPKEDQNKVFSNLLQSIENNDYMLTTGDIGYYFLLHVLSDMGRSDIIYKMNSSSDRPGYLYQLEKGATALTESWNALPYLSNNHMMLGHLMEWFYFDLGGITQEKNSTAYEKIVFSPKPLGNISWVKCCYKSPKGEIKSDWNLRGDTFEYQFTIPPETSAKIEIPDGFKHADITMKNLKSNVNLTVESRNGMLDLNSGEYLLICRNN